MVERATTYEEAIADVTCVDCKLRTVCGADWIKAARPDGARYAAELREELLDGMLAAKPTPQEFDPTGESDDILSGLSEFSREVTLTNNGQEIGGGYGDEAENRVDIAKLPLNNIGQAALACMTRIARGECTEADRAVQ